MRARRAEVRVLEETLEASKPACRRQRAAQGNWSPAKQGGKRKVQDQEKDFPAEGTVHAKAGI